MLWLITEHKSHKVCLHSVVYLLNRTVGWFSTVLCHETNLLGKTKPPTHTLPLPIQAQPPYKSLNPLLKEVSTTDIFQKMFFEAIFLLILLVEFQKCIVLYISIE